MADLQLCSIDDILEELRRRCTVSVIAVEYSDEETGPQRSNSRLRMFGHPFACAGMARALADECAKEALKLKFPELCEPEPDDDRA